MDASHVSAAGITAALMVVIVWLGTVLAIPGVDEKVAGALAFLLVCAGAAAVKLYQSRFKQ